MKIAFVHFPGRIARLPAARAGTGPTEFLFGAVELERAGHEVDHYEVDPGAPVSRVAARLVDVNAGRGHLPPHLAAAVLTGTRSLLPALRGAEVVLATTTATAMALAVWRRAGLLRRPLVGIVAGLLNAPWRQTRRVTTMPLLRAMHAVLYGPGELAGMLALGDSLRGRVHVVPFGADAGYWSPGDPAREPEVLAIGNDGHRDWATLVRAAAEIPAPVRILTGQPRPDEWPAAGRSCSRGRGASGRPRACATERTSSSLHLETRPSSRGRYAASSRTSLARRRSARRRVPKCSERRPSRPTPSACWRSVVSRSCVSEAR